MSEQKILKKNKPINKQLTKSKKQESKPQTNSVKIDKRFEKASYDPKFMAPSSKVTKIKVDKRFNKMFTDASFKSTSKIDRYGREIDEEENNNQLNDYYYMDKEQEQEIDQNESQSEKAQPDDIRKWMENYDEESSEDIEDMQIEQLENVDVQIWSDDDENMIKGENVQVTKRLALCNYDWTHITSKDLMLLFNSFKTSNGYIKSVKVYMSNIGKIKMEQEEKHGPQGIWKAEGAKKDQEEKPQWRKTWKQLVQQRQNDNNEAFNENKLRKYEKQRLKYFYAVIQCDSKRTADQIYRQCDGNQFENSNLPFDLRYIPDEIQFDRANLKQECNQIPSSGQVKNFVSRALGHSKVNLTWEDPELSLPASLKKKNWNRLSDEQLQKIDWSMYINDDEIEQEGKLKKIVKEQKKEENIISDWKKSSNKKYRKDDDLQIKFEGGFQSSKNKNKVNSQQVPSLNKQKRTMKQRWKQNQEQKRKRKQQLSLLVQDNKGPDFKLNLEDSRFQAVFENPNFAIDPADHRFDHRKSGNVFAQVVKRNKNKNLQ